MYRFRGIGSEHHHIAPYEANSDHPAVLCSRNAGPTPVEWLLVALAACITVGIGNIAAARGVTLHRVQSTIEGDIDLRNLKRSAQRLPSGPYRF